MNKVFQTGRLTKDVSLAETPAGVPIATFTIAVVRPYPSVNGNETDFFNCVAYRSVAENCHQFLRKGSKAFFEGYLRNRTYEGRDGLKRTVTEIALTNVEFLEYGENQPHKANEGENETKTNEEVKQLIREQVKLEEIEGGNLPF